MGNMGKYVLKRLLIAIPTFLGITVLVFGLWKVLPFDSLFAGIGIALLTLALGMKKPKA